MQEERGRARMKNNESKNHSHYVNLISSGRTVHNLQAEFAASLYSSWTFLGLADVLDLLAMREMEEFVALNSSASKNSILKCTINRRLFHPEKWLLCHMGLCFGRRF